MVFLDDEASTWATTEGASSTLGSDVTGAYHGEFELNLYSGPGFFRSDRCDRRPKTVTVVCSSPGYSPLRFSLRGKDLTALNEHLEAAVLVPPLCLAPSPAPAADVRLKASAPLLAVEEKREVMAWSTTAGTRYLLPEDPCYDMYRLFLASDKVRFFASAEAAKRAGFQRKPVGLVPLKKYADVCSPLYEYALASNCEKVFMEKAGRSGFVPIERFKSNLAEVKVVGIERSKTYLTPCDEDYQCFIDAKKDRSPECQQMVESTGGVRVFSSERGARDAGFVSVAESLFHESGKNF
jgi:hypothetical protein